MTLSGKKVAAVIVRLQTMLATNTFRRYPDSYPYRHEVLDHGYVHYMAVAEKWQEERSATIMHVAQCRQHP